MTKVIYSILITVFFSGCVQYHDIYDYNPIIDTSSPLSIQQRVNEKIIVVLPDESANWIESARSARNATYELKLGNIVKMIVAAKLNQVFQNGVEFKRDILTEGKTLYLSIESFKLKKKGINIGLDVRSSISIQVKFIFDSKMILEKTYSEEIREMYLMYNGINRNTHKLVSLITDQIIYDLMVAMQIDDQQNGKEKQ